MNDIRSTNVAEGEPKVSAFLLTELSIYVSQALMFFFVAILVSNFLRSEQQLLAFMNSRINDNSIYDLVATLFAVSGVFLIILAVRGMAPHSTAARAIADEVLAEAPRTIYVFGSSVTGAIVAAALFLRINPDPTAPLPGALVFVAILWGSTAFIYGFGLAFVFKYKMLIEVSRGKPSLKE